MLLDAIAMVHLESNWNFTLEVQPHQSVALDMTNLANGSIELANFWIATGTSRPSTMPSIHMSYEAVNGERDLAVDDAGKEELFRISHCLVPYML